jgi:DNA transformation protein
MAIPQDFAEYCCELLSTVGPCRAKRMFGGWGISVEGLTLAILADLSPPGATAQVRLYLKASEATRGQYEAAGCLRFVYNMKGVDKGLNYYAAPDEAMESPDAMRAWAQLAYSCAVQAQLEKSKPRPKRAAKKKAPAT